MFALKFARSTVILSKVQVKIRFKNDQRFLNIKAKIKTNDKKTHLHNSYCDTSKLNSFTTKLNIHFLK